MTGNALWQRNVSQVACSGTVLDAVQSDEFMSQMRWETEVCSQLYNLQTRHSTRVERHVKTHSTGS